MSEYKGTLESNDIEWLQEISTGGGADILLSVGRSQRILNTIKQLREEVEELESKPDYPYEEIEQLREQLDKVREKQK